MGKLTTGVLAIGAVLASSAGVSTAIDGVIEINQTSALAGGLIADGPGFPVTLAVRGSYRLTSELNVPADTNGIVIQNDQIHLDLNGFSIVGGGGTSGIGVSAAEAVRSARVSNGTVRLMAGGGVILEGTDATVERVTAIGNGGAGGIEVGADSVVTASVASGNDFRGIRAGTNSIIERCTVNDTTGIGIQITSGNVSHIVSSNNDSDGVNAGQGSNVSNSTAVSNGGDGFDVSGVSALIGSTARDNTLFGFRGSSSTGYVHNVLGANNGTDPEVSGGQQMGINVCGNALCP